MPRGDLYFTFLTRLRSLSLRRTTDFVGLVLSNLVFDDVVVVVVEVVVIAGSGGKSSDRH